MQQPRQHLDGGRLAGAIRSQKGEELALFDAQIEFANRGQIAKLLGKLESLDHGTESFVGGPATGRAGEASPIEIEGIRSYKEADSISSATR